MMVTMYGGSIHYRLTLGSILSEGFVCTLATERLFNEFAISFQLLPSAHGSPVWREGKSPENQWFLISTLTSSMAFSRPQVFHLIGIIRRPEL